MGMWIGWLFLMLMIPALPSPQQGQIVESVSCQGRPDHKYALYLPSNYDEQRQWPLVIFLDPAARGAAPLQAFAPAAESLGYVLVGSHNSQNGPLEPSIEALTLLWNEVSQRYSIDPARVYLGGFSGGARMVSHFAKSAKVAGVIACGAGLLSGDAEEFPFAYAAVAGRRDMNYLEVRVLAENLQHRHTRATFVEFEGSHDWPPPETARQVLEWLKLEGMRQRLEPVSSDFVDSYRDAAMQRARTLEESGEAFEALLAYRALLRDVEGLGDISAASVRVSLLEDDPRVEDQRRLQSRTDDVERKELRSLFDQFLSDRPSKGEEWWRRKLESYRKLGERKLRNADALSQRLEQFILNYAVEKAWFAAEAEEFPKALYLTRVALLARPDSAELHYRKARLQALTDDPEGALESLRKAVELGWNDSSRLEHDDAFRELRRRSEFQRLLPAG